MNCDFQKRSPNRPGCLKLAWAVKTKSKWHLKDLFIFIELRLSEKSMKAKPKWQLKVLFILIELRISEKSVKSKPKWQLKVLLIFIELGLSKKIIKKRTVDLDFESKTKMTVESPFHFIELRLSVTFCWKRKGHDMFSLEFDRLKTFIFPVVGFMSLPKICTVSAKLFLLRLLCKV